MRIAVDAQPLLGRRAGIGTYVYEVLKRLPGFFPDDEIRLVLFRFLKREPLPEGILKGNVTVRRHALFPRKALEGLLKAGVPLPFPLFSGEADAFLFPNFIAYPTSGKPAALIVYDLSYLRHPDKSEKKNQRFLTRFVPSSLKRATAVITISEFSRREIAEVYGIPPERIRIAYPGVDSGVFHPGAGKENIEDLLARYRLPSEYILFVGTLEPRKGIEALLDAYESWTDNHKLPLVLVGKQGWGDMPRLERALKGKIRGVFHLGYVAPQDLPSLLAHARLFVYPSVYEGFGMPVLEAMACGVPVVCGNCPSLKEIGGQLLGYCEPQSPDAIASALVETLTSPPSQEKLREGVDRARTFTWDTTAREIAKTLRRLGPPPMET